MQIVTAEKVESETLQALFAWYRERCTPDGWPPVSAFRAETIPPQVLPHIARVQVETKPFRVFYRAVGSAFGESFGIDMTGRYLDELGIKQADDLHEWYRMALGATGPVIMRDAQTVSRHSFVYEGGGLPLGTPDDKPREFISCTDFLNAPAWRSALRERKYGRPGR